MPERWFASSAAYDKQAKRGLIDCPLCGSSKVEKALMTRTKDGREKEISRDRTQMRELRGADVALTNPK